jgi:hypothetical protein
MSSENSKISEIEIGCLLPDVKLSALTKKDWRMLSLLIQSGIMTAQLHSAYIQNVSLALDEPIDISYARVHLCINTSTTDRCTENGSEHKCPKCESWVAAKEFYAHTTACKGVKTDA